MSTHKWIDAICILAMLLAAAAAFLFCNGRALGLETNGRTMGYENRLFDRTRVHTIDIVMSDWEGFIEPGQNEEYSSCSVVIDGEAYKNVGIRAKGNTSLSSVAGMGSSRYSFKIEFDQYDPDKSYYGLDKICLNNLIQDHTCMKDYLAYTLMADFGVAAPLCSYVYITVNGEEWGLYLAVEAVEESFLQRNYGSDYGQLYKPDSQSLGAGRQSGEAGMRPDEREKMPAMPGGMGSEDVKLQYIDEDPDSYPNIFDNAKTDASQADQTRLIASLKKLSESNEIESAVDIEAVMRYFVVHNFLCNDDSYTGTMVHNYYLYEEEGRLSMIPWDYNLAFGGFGNAEAFATVNAPIDTPVSGELSDRPMVSWIFAKEAYTRQYHALFEEWLAAADLSARIEEAAELISTYVQRDPTKFCTYEEYEQGVAALRDFCVLRTESIRGQLAGTIPSTKEEQAVNRENLVETGALNLSDMGTMQTGGGFKEEADGLPFEESAGWPPDGFLGEGPANRPTEELFTEQAENGPPEGFVPESKPTAQAGGAVWGLMGISAVVLLMGLAAAYKWKR